ncbi:MAG: dihydrolipoyl dehydrogenase [Peptococcaceae bacterium]|nr:dihydrolipoyl dehydrogenase [Peptococcaceae bacterium]
MDYNVDLTVVGAGPGGYAAAIRAAQMGAKVVLVEKDQPGGTCLNRGCIPTKTLVETADLARKFAKAREYGFTDIEVKIDLQRVMARKNLVVENLRNGLVQLFRKNKITLVKAMAEVRQPGKVHLTLDSGEEEVIKTKNIVLATGSRSLVPPIEGIDIPAVYNSDTILEITALPGDLVIIGGGVIGLEFASIFSALGTKVTIIEMLPNLLPVVDKDLSRRLLPVLKKSGIKVYTGTTVQRVEEVGSKIQLTTAAAGENKTLTAGAVLLAAGRTPAVTGINVDALGLELNGKAVKVNERMETNIPGIYAVGDCTGGIMLAHVALAEGIVAAENALGGHAAMDYTVVPNCIFTYPEIGSVGLMEDEAKEQGMDVSVSRFPFAALGKAVAAGETFGMVKLVAEEKTGRLLGGHVLGPHATELIAEIALAVKKGLTAADVAGTIHGHPTLSEATAEAAHGINGKPLHSV